MTSADAKRQVSEFWNEASCGEELYLATASRAGYLAQSRERYALEPYIQPFARFEQSRGKKVLEIGVGLGADHQCFAEAGADLFGIDLTPRAIEHVRRRFAAFGLPCRVALGDAENLPFPDACFDLVYAWGVIHHSPDTGKAAGEIRRVLKPDGRFRVMIYHTYSMVGFMLWLRYALLRLRPFTPLAEIYANHLESPGTKAYTLDEARALFRGASDVQAWTVLTHGDLLTSQAGQQHRGSLLSLARVIWPRALLRRVFPRSGLFLLVEGINRGN
jgi:SAM-dependent methyltransferase